MNVDGHGRHGVALAWSTGKDSALTFGALAESGRRPRVLFTTVIDGAVPMHRSAIRIAEAQAAAVGLPLVTLELPDPYDHDRYLAELHDLAGRPPLDVEAVAFGDLHLADLRARREADLAAVGLTGLFPLWSDDTLATARRIVASGITATICSVDTAQAPAELLGRPYDGDAIQMLVDAGGDPCGEYGEIHTVVTDAPWFAAPIELREVSRITTGQFHAIEFDVA